MRLHERVADDAADRGEHRADDERQRVQESALEQREATLLHEIREQPLREDVEHVIHAEVAGRQQQHVPVHDAPCASRPAASAPRLRRRAAGVDDRELLRA